MRNRILTTAAILTIATVSAFSQSVTEKRHIKTTALQIYENYKVVMSGLYSTSPYTEDNFMALFDNNSILYNDILPDNNPQQFSPGKYFAKFKANIKRIYPTFRDFKIGEPVSRGGKWQIKCNFTRGTKYSTLKDMKYPLWSFNYIITIEMDKRYDTNKRVYENAKIVSVDVENPLKGFFIIENKKNIVLTTNPGDTIKDWDEEYQSRIFPEKDWKIKDIHISEPNNNNNIFEYSKSRFSKNQTDDHFYQLTVQRFPKNIFGVGVNYSPFGFGNKMSEDFENIQPANSALSLSLFYGKQVYHKEKATGFVKLGLDVNRYSYGYSSELGKEIILDRISNRLSNRLEADNDDKLRYRTIQIDLLNKKINFTSVSVPVSFEYVQQLTEQSRNPIFLSFELGMFAEYTFSSDKHLLRFTHCGYYDYFGKDNLTKMEHYYDYGNFDVSLKQNFAFGVFGGVGLWFALNNSNLLKFNITYKHNLNLPIEYKENRLTLPNLEHSYNAGMRNIGFGISWVKTIGEKK